MWPHFFFSKKITSDYTRNTYKIINIKATVNWKNDDENNNTNNDSMLNCKTIKEKR